MKISFINSILNSQPFLINFALKLFVCKSFQTHALSVLKYKMDDHIFTALLYMYGRTFFRL